MPFTEDIAPFLVVLRSHEVWRARLASLVSVPATWQCTYLRPTFYFLLTTHYSLPTTHYSLLTTHHSPLTTQYSLLTTPYSLLTTPYSLLSTHYPLLTTHYSLPVPHSPFLTPRPSLPVPFLTPSTRLRMCSFVRKYLPPPRQFDLTCRLEKRVWLSAAGKLIPHQLL